MGIPRAWLGLMLLPPGIALLDGLQSRASVPATTPATTPAQSSASGATPQSATKERVSSPALTETDTLRLILTRDTIRSVQFLKNDSDGAASVECVRAALRDSTASAFLIDARANGRGCAPNDLPKALLGRWSLTPIHVSLPVPAGAPPFVGHLIIALRDSASGRSYAAQRPVRIAPAPIARGSPYAERFVFWTFVAALLVAGIAALTAPKGTPPSSAPSWDPKTSWASNVGVAGGLITALMTAAFLPEQPRYLAKPAYALLSAVFVAITALAPSAYAFIARISAHVWVRAAAVAGASAVTLWGALGQLATGWALFGELAPARVLPSLPTRTFQGLMIGLAVLLLIYAVVSIRSILTPPTADAAAAAVAAPPYTLL